MLEIVGLDEGRAVAIGEEKGSGLSADEAVEGQAESIRLVGTPAHLGTRGKLQVRVVENVVCSLIKSITNERQILKSSNEIKRRKKKG